MKTRNGRAEMRRRTIKIRRVGKILEKIFEVDKQERMKRE